MIGLDLCEVKKKMVEVGGSGEQVGEGEVFCSQGVAHMAEPNVTLMTGSLSLSGAKARPKDRTLGLSSCPECYATSPTNFPKKLLTKDLASEST